MAEERSSGPIVVVVGCVESNCDSVRKHAEKCDRKTRKARVGMRVGRGEATRQQRRAVYLKDGAEGDSKVVGSHAECRM
jgi:hypothetical protein